MLWGLLLSLAALIGGIYDKAHFVPINDNCHTMAGLFGRVISSQADADCSLAGTVAPWSTALIVLGVIGLVGYAGFFVFAVVAANNAKNTKATKTNP